MHNIIYYAGWFAIISFVVWVVIGGFVTFIIMSAFTDPYIRRWRRKMFINKVLHKIGIRVKFKDDQRG